MPLVIEAIEKYGRESAFSLLRDGEKLCQTDETLDWLFGELRNDFNFETIDDDNYCCAVALVISYADTDLLAKRWNELENLPAFPVELRGPVAERLEMGSWGVERGWEAMEALGRAMMKKGGFSQNDDRRADRIIECLAQYPDERGDFTMALLRREYPGKGNEVMDWLYQHIVRLAGEMRLKEAIPVLAQLLGGDDELASDEALMALCKIGGDEVVDAVTARWGNADDDLRFAIAEILEHIHTDRSVERCRQWLEIDEEFDVQIALGNALMSHFCLDAIESVRLLVNDEEEDMYPDQFDLRYRLIAVSTIMGVTFPEYDEWHDEAIASNWGRGDRQRSRLRDAFRMDPVAGDSGNGKPK
ncbi:hypothetical protein Pla8534_19070 [Lignipirellula cremea]|uniref:HEAT repeat domain-containing protein n=2 Tax=Lignipirellula cremea TaxID=2528010 RepID=A0A518DQK8_9BACT|nr:hypothetical protein Pla8534_19070 [Lignipirellula cremea]